jgi:hypothetical protein
LDIHVEINKQEEEKEKNKEKEVVAASLFTSATTHNGISMS